MAALSSAVQARQLADKQWRDLHTRKVLRVGIDPGWQPFSFYGTSGWEGLDADLTGEMARRMGLQAQPIPVGYDAMYDALQLWQVDVVISAVAVDPARMADVSYTTAYFDAGLRLVATEGAGIRSTDDLTGKRVAAALGSDADRAARYWERRSANMQRMSVTDNDAAIRAVQAGQADAAIVEALSAIRLVLPSDDLTSISIAPQPYAIAVRRDNPLLLAALNRALADMRMDGTLDLLVMRWVGP